MKDFPELKKDMHTQNEELHQVPHIQRNTPSDIEITESKGEKS